MREKTTLMKTSPSTYTPANKIDEEIFRKFQGVRRLLRQHSHAEKVIRAKREGCSATGRWHTERSCRRVGSGKASTTTSFGTSVDHLVECCQAGTCNVLYHVQSHKGDSREPCPSRRRHWGTFDRQDITRHGCLQLEQQPLRLGLQGIGCWIPDCHTCRLPVLL